MHPNYCQITILLVVDLCSSLAYFMMTQPLPIAGKIPIKTLVARQLPTNACKTTIVQILEPCQSACDRLPHRFRLQRDQWYLHGQGHQTGSPPLLRVSAPTRHRGTAGQTGEGGRAEEEEEVPSKATEILRQVRGGREGVAICVMIIKFFVTWWVGRLGYF